MLYFSKAKLEKLRKKRIAARYDLSGRPTTEELVRRLLQVEPKWGPILRTCITIAKERGEVTKKTTNSGGFAGAWVIQALRVAGIPPPSNLRLLTVVGLIKLEHTTRGGNRVYYTIPDAKSITKALKTFRK